MKRRQFVRYAGLGAAALALPPWLGCKERSTPGTGRPSNIIFIMADDMGYGDLGCYNSESRILTPNMDRLAAEGIQFTDAHAPAAVCSPTRYGLLTGRYCWRTWLKRKALIGYSPPLLEPDRSTVASLLHEQGYRTACIGKWHLGLEWTLKPGEEVDFYRPLDWPYDYIIEVGNKIDYNRPVRHGPIDHGFNYFFGTAGCSTTDPPYVFIENDRAVGIPSVMSTEEMDCDPGLMVPDWKQEEADTTFVEKAIEFIRDNRDRSHFVYLALSAPHAPHLPPDFVKGRSSTGPRGDMVAWVDWSVGQVLEAVDHYFLRDNTLVIVTSDNGPLPGEAGHKSAGYLRGFKAHIWEGGHRVPFIARWPGHIQPSTISEEPIELTDLLATCAALTGATLGEDDGPDSYDIMPALLGSELSKPIREALVHHSGSGVFAIRKGNWKLILETKTSGGWVEPSGKPPVAGAPGQLYNLEEDPYERNDLWNTYPGVVEELTALLKKYQEQGYSRPWGA